MKLRDWPTKDINGGSWCTDWAVSVRRLRRRRQDITEEAMCGNDMGVCNVFTVNLFFKICPENLKFRYNLLQCDAISAISAFRSRDPFQIFLRK